MSGKFLPKTLKEGFQHQRKEMHILYAPAINAVHQITPQQRGCCQESHQLDNALSNHHFAGCPMRATLLHLSWTCSFCCRRFLLNPRPVGRNAFPMCVYAHMWVPLKQPQKWSCGTNDDPLANTLLWVPDQRLLAAQQNHTKYTFLCVLCTMYIQHRSIVISRMF